MAYNPLISKEFHDMSQNATMGSGVDATHLPSGMNPTATVYRNPARGFQRIKACILHMALCKVGTARCTVFWIW